MPGGKKTIKADIRKYWGQAVDLEQDMFQSRKHHQFLGFVMTDRVSISAVHETKEELTETSAKHTCDKLQQQEQEQLVAQRAWLLYQLPSYQLQLPSVLVQQQQQQTQTVQQQQQRRKQADCMYISELSQEQLQSTTGHCVLVDPGRQDLLFMLHEKSTIEEKHVYHYTRNQQCRETKQKKYRKIRKRAKKADKAGITTLEPFLAASSTSARPRLARPRLPPLTQTKTFPTVNAGEPTFQRKPTNQNTFPLEKGGGSSNGGP